MLINCDIGERGTAHPVDDALMQYIDIANIACGGHAGDEESIAHYKALAEKYGVKVTAHLSYKDKENFGRKVLDISVEALLVDLEEQASRFGDMVSVKFHGALYNQANIDPMLAEALVQWLLEKEVKEILAPYGGMMQKAANQLGLNVIHEAFADRAYTHTAYGVQLMPRSQEGAVLESIEDVVRQVRKMRHGSVEIEGKHYLMEADSVCVHSDSENSLEMVKALCVLP